MNGPDAELNALAELKALGEVRLGSEQVLAGGFLQVWRDQVRVADGGTAQREYIKHPGAVVVVALLEGAQPEAVLVRQYRYPLERVMWEFPAGKIDDAEQPSTPGLAARDALHPGVWRCALRELAEETGYRATHWAHAGVMHNAIAYSDEVIHICFAKGLAAGALALDEGEFIATHRRSLDAMLADLREGWLTDAKTITALAWWQQLAAGQWQPQWHAAASLGVEGFA
jgi:ADP-ribose pyrophosphatase